MGASLLDRPFIKSPYLASLLDIFDLLRHKKNEFGVASCMLLTGESGSGKSELAKQYTKKNPVVELDERTFIPVLHFELQSISTIEEFLKSLLVAFRDPQNGLGARNRKELYSRLIRLVKTAGTELLLLDEIQVIIERRSAKVLTGIADLFKDLIKDTEIPIVFMGMPWSRQLVDSNPQLSRRIKYRYVIPPFRISEKTYRNEYRGFLKLLAESYGLSEKIKLEEISMTFRIFSATSGNLSATAELVCDAFILSKENGRKIDINLFADVLRSYGIHDEYNSFILPIEKIEMRELISHSDWHYGYRANKNSIIEAEYTLLGVTTDKRVYSLNHVA